jgi:hypothetical protein
MVLELTVPNLSRRGLVARSAGLIGTNMLGRLLAAFCRH